jgi:hypothetical protein
MATQNPNELLDNIYTIYGITVQNNSPPQLRRLPGQRDTEFVDYRVIPYMSPIKKIIFNHNINESYYIHEDAF